MAAAAESDDQVARALAEHVDGGLDRGQRRLGGDAVEHFAPHTGHILYVAESASIASRPAKYTNTGTNASPRTELFASIKIVMAPPNPRVSPIAWTTPSAIISSLS